MNNQMTMQRGNYFKLSVAGVILAGGLVLAALTNAPAAHSALTPARFANASSVVEEGGAPPVVVEAIAGSEISRVTLSDEAAHRLRVETAPVATRTVNGVDQLTVPFGAVLYDPSGGTWVYTNPEPQ